MAFENPFSNSTFGTPDYRKMFANTATAQPLTAPQPASGQSGFGGLGTKEPFNLSNTELFKQSASTAADQMKGNIPGLDIAENQQREAVKTGLALQAKNVREGLIGQGFKDSGKFIQQGIIQPEQEKQRTMAEFDRGLIAQRAQLAMEQQKAGQGAANNLLALQSAESTADKGLAQNAMQFDDEMKFKAWATQAGFDDAAANRAWQSAENTKSLGSSEKIAFAGLSLEEKKMAQNAMQFNDELSYKRWATQAGLDDASAARIWQGVENQKSRDSTEKLAFAGLSMEEKKLAQDAAQFTSRLDYDKWATQSGLDDAAAARVWQGLQNAKEIESREKISFAGLSFQEKQLAQQATQFTDELAFKQWATQAGLNDNEAQRVWQAAQNDNSLRQQRDLATMQNDTERWKIDRAENLTKAGWDHETAMQMADNEAKATQAELDRYLTREVELGRLSIQDKQIAIQASQFANEMEFKQWATQAGLDADRQKMIWQANENNLDRVQQTVESSLDRQLQREVEGGRLSIEELKLAQNASQFDSELEWQKEAQKQNLDAASAARIWESSENSKDRAHETSMNLMAQQFEERGMKFAAVMDYLQTMNPEQAASSLMNIAKSIGMDIPEVTAQGMAKEQAQIISTKLSEGKTITEKEAKQLLDAESSGMDTGFDFASSDIENSNTLTYTRDGWNRWVLNDAAKNWVSQNTGKIYKATNGRLYQVVGAKESKDRNSAATITFKDLVTGATVNYKQGGHDNDTAFPS